MSSFTLIVWNMKAGFDVKECIDWADSSRVGAYILGSNVDSSSGALSGISSVSKQAIFIFNVLTQKERLWK